MRFNFIQSNIIVSLVLSLVLLVTPSQVSASNVDELDAQVKVKQQEIIELENRIEEVQARMESNNNAWNTAVDAASVVDSSDIKSHLLNSLTNNFFSETELIITNLWEYISGTARNQRTKDTARLNAQIKTYEKEKLQKQLEIEELEALKNGASDQEIKNLQEQHAEQIVEAAKQVDQAELDSITACSIANPEGCVLKALAGTLNLFASIAAYIVWVANGIFNFVVRLSVIEFPIYAGMDIVNQTWGVVRDICNLFFIFILLYIAIGTVLESFGTFNTKGLLAKIIVVALLVNFSAIIPKVVIDISNIVSLQFYNRITAVAGGDLTSQIVKSFEFDKLGKKIVSDPNSNVFVDSSQIIIAGSLGKILLYLITAFVLLAGAFMFLGRFLLLLAIIISSPLYFLGMAIPYVGQHSNKWMSTLISQALFAPVMLFLMLVTFVVVADGNSSLSNELMKSASGNFGLKTIIYFTIVNGMMLGSFIAASKMGAAGAGVASKYGNKTRTWATGLVGAGVGAGTFGLAGALGRNTIGRRASRMADDKNLIDRAAKGSIVAKMQLQAARKVAGSSFDARATKIGGAVAKNVGLGKDTGKGGYQAKLNNQVKAEEKFVKDSGFTEEQQRKYAESLENRGRFGAPVKWFGTPRKRQKAAEKIGDLKERRKVEAENAAIEERNRAAESSNQSLDLTVQQARNNAGYVAAKRQLEQEEQKLKQAEDGLRVALASGNQATIDNMKKAVETRRLMVEAAEKDFNKLEKPIKDLEATRKKPEEKKVYKRKEKPLKDQLKEVLKEEDDEKKKSSAGTPPPAPKTP